MLKNHKVFYIFLVLGFIMAMMVAIGRFNVESENKAVDFILDYSEVSKLALQSEEDISVWLKNFKDMGINKVGLYEESLNSLIEEGKPVKAELMKNVVKDIYWKEKLPDNLVARIEANSLDENDILVTVNSESLYDFIKNGFKSRYDSDKFISIEGEEADYIYIDSQAEHTLFKPIIKYQDTMKKDFVEVAEAVSSKLMTLSIGLDNDKVRIIENAGMSVIPRTVGYDGWNDEKFEAAVINEYKGLKKTPEYIMFAGSEIIGQDAGSSALKEYIYENDIKIAMIETTFQRENIEQSGLIGLVEESGYNAVRAFTTWNYIQNRYQYYNYPGSEEIENTFFRAVIERNIRLIYFKPFKEFKDNYIYITDVAEYKRMFDSLEKRLETHNVSFGEASVMMPYKIGLMQKWIITVGAIAGGMILLTAFIPLKAKYRYGMFSILAILALGAYEIRPVLAELLSAFGAAVVFPCLAVLYLLNKCRKYMNLENESEGLANILKWSIKDLVAAVCISLAGAIYTSSVIADINYLLEINIFRGVKAAQLIPIVIFALLYISFIGLNLEQKNSKLSIKAIKDILNANIKVWVVIVGLVLLAAGYIYIARTGQETSVQPMNIEMILRNFLENVLLARPRTKEFLIAFPALMLTIYTIIRRLGWLPFIFGLAAVIGQTSVVNTFMHLRTPIYLSITRTGYSLLFGVIFGIIYIVVLEAVIRLYKKIREKYCNA